MALVIDAAGALRNPQELTDLVQAILNAQPQDESDWIEWKSTLDLSQRETHGTIARHILGMSNRKPEDATRHAGGCGYIVVGVEPGNCAGVTPVDPAVLGQGVLPYLGSGGPGWSAQYVQASGRSVLVVTAEPPQAGSRIFTLRKECPKPGGGPPYLAGAIFVRRPGRTVQAQPDDIRALEDRFTAIAQPIALIVRPADAGQALEIRPVANPGAVLDPWLARQRSELLPPVRSAAATPEAGDPGTGFRLAPEFERVADEAAAAFRQMSPVLDAFSEPDRRTAEDYETEVQDYLSESSAYYANLAFSRYALQSDAQMTVELVNASERNYTDVQVEIHVPGSFDAYDPDLIVMPDDEPPEPPLPRGARTPRSYLTADWRLPPGLVVRPAVAPRLGEPVPKFSISNADGARITFEVGRVRPGQRILLDPVVLLPSGSFAVGDRAEVAWTIAAGNVDGVARGMIELTIGQPVHPAQLLPELSSADEPGAGQDRARPE